LQLWHQLQKTKDQVLVDEMVAMTKSFFTRTYSPLATPQVPYQPSSSLRAVYPFVVLSLLVLCQGGYLVLKMLVFACPRTVDLVCKTIYGEALLI
jgi:hypothetical protein